MARNRPHSTPLGILIAIALGGAIGAVLRWALAEAFPQRAGDFPWTTFAENISGALLLGLVATVIIERVRPTRVLQPFLCIGVLGSFTTFSNLSVELTDLAGPGGAARPMAAAAYAAGSLCAGLIAAMAGMMVGRRLLRLPRASQWHASVPRGSPRANHRTRRPPEMRS